MQAAIRVGERASNQYDPQRKLQSIPPGARASCRFDGDRHLRSLLSTPSTVMCARSKLLPPRHRAPEWFHRILTAQLTDKSGRSSRNLQDEIAPWCPTLTHSEGYGQVRAPILTVISKPSGTPSQNAAPSKGHPGSSTPARLEELGLVRAIDNLVAFWQKKRNRDLEAGLGFGNSGGPARPNGLSSPSKVSRQCHATSQVDAD
jgi:hypothetical protein